MRQHTLVLAVCATVGYGCGSAGSEPVDLSGMTVESDDFTVVVDADGSGESIRAQATSKDDGSDVLSLDVTRERVVTHFPGLDPSPVYDFDEPLEELPSIENVLGLAFFIAGAVHSAVGTKSFARKDAPGCDFVPAEILTPALLIAFARGGWIGLGIEAVAILGRQESLFIRLETPRTLACCAEHDYCYHRFGCTIGSLLGNQGGDCTACNAAAIGCWNNVNYQASAGLTCYEAACSEPPKSDVDPDAVGNYFSCEGTAFGAESCECLAPCDNPRACDELLRCCPQLTDEVSMILCDEVRADGGVYKRDRLRVCADTVERSPQCKEGAGGTAGTGGQGGGGMGGAGGQGGSGHGGQGGTGGTAGSAGAGGAGGQGGVGGVGGQGGMGGAGGYGARGGSGGVGGSYFCGTTAMPDLSYSGAVVEECYVLCGNPACCYVTHPFCMCHCLEIGPTDFAENPVWSCASAPGCAYVP